MATGAADQRQPWQCAQDRKIPVVVRGAIPTCKTKNLGEPPSAAV